MRSVVCFSIFAFYLLGVVAPSESLFYSKVKVDIVHSHGDDHHQHNLEVSDKNSVTAAHQEVEIEHHKDSNGSEHHHHNILVFVSNLYISSVAAVLIPLGVPIVEADFQKIQMDALPKSLYLKSIFRPPIA